MITTTDTHTRYPHPAADDPTEADSNRPEQSVGDCEAATDSELVQRFVGGDEASFVEIVRRYEAKIRTVAQGLLHNMADAEEITQDTFIRAYRSLPRFRGDSSLATWLHRIAVNLARNRYWYFFRRRRHATLSLDGPVGEEGNAILSDLLAADVPDPSRTASREEFASLIAVCMERLDPRHREVLILRNVYNHSYDEIAAQLSINVGTVKSRIARARERLRARLVEACPEFTPDAAPAEWFEPARAVGRLTAVWA
jgi:RNA polymerase sigma-70 factor (ECF subfamily)